MFFRLAVVRQFHLSISSTTFSRQNHDLSLENSRRRFICKIITAQFCSLLRCQTSFLHGVCPFCPIHKRLRSSNYLSCRHVAFFVIVSFLTKRDRRERGHCPTIRPIFCGRTSSHSRIEISIPLLARGSRSYPPLLLRLLGYLRPKALWGKVRCHLDIRNYIPSRKFGSIDFVDASSLRLLFFKRHPPRSTPFIVISDEPFPVASTVSLSSRRENSLFWCGWWCIRLYTLHSRRRRRT